MIEGSVTYLTRVFAEIKKFVKAKDIPVVNTALDRDLHFCEGQGWVAFCLITSEVLFANGQLTKDMTLMTGYGRLGLPEAHEKGLPRKRHQKPEIHNSTYFLLFLVQIPKPDLYFRPDAFQTAFAVVL